MSAAGAPATLMVEGSGVVTTADMSSVPEQASAGPQHSFAYLDGLRFIAAFLVMCAHTLGVGYARPNFISQVIHSLGHYGVAVFFCLSGFLLFRPFVSAILDDRPFGGLKRYYERRLLRIFPLFWVAVVAYLVFVPLPKGRTPDTPFEWVAMFLMGQVYFPDGLEWVISAAWTLGVELAFYIVLPLIAVGIRAVARRAGTTMRHRLVGVYFGLGLVALVGITYRLVTYEMLGTGNVATGFPIAWLDWFAAGMALSTAVTAHSRGVAYPAWLYNLGRWPALSWMASFGCYWVAVNSYYYFVYFPTVAQAFVRHWGILAAGFFLLVPAVVETAYPSPIRSLLVAKPMHYLGVISYGIYLWHPAFVQIFFNETGKTFLGITVTRNPWQNLAFVFVCTVLTASLTYFGIEKVFMSIRSRPNSVSSSPKGEPSR